MAPAAPSIKLCIRCEEPISKDGPRYFRAVVVDGAQRILEYFDEPCFKTWNPTAAEYLR